MKKILSVLLALTMIFSFTAVGFASQANEDDEEKGRWIATWGSSPVDYYISLSDYISGLFVNSLAPEGSTLRTELKLSAAGEKLKLKFSNMFGDKPVTFSDATVARTNTSRRGAVDKASLAAVTFGGQSSVTIPVGGYVWSDEIIMHTDALETLSVSTYFSHDTYIKTAGLFCGRTYMSTGFSSQTWSRSLLSNAVLSVAAGGCSYYIIPLLTEIAAYSRDENAYSAVLIGDSTIVNDCTSYLSERLVSVGYNNISVINEGIMGNRLLYDGVGLIGNLYGRALKDRFMDDAVNITGCDLIIVKIGINDILHPSSKSMGATAAYASAEEIIAGYEQLIETAHAHGKRIYFMELTPWHGYVRNMFGFKDDIIWRSDLQAMCDTVNKWIKTNKLADGYINSDELASPADYTSLRSQLTQDGIHLSDLGAVALADCFNMNDVFGIDKYVAPVSEINGVDPYNTKSNQTTNAIRQMLSNAFLFIRQLLVSLKIEFQPLNDLLDSLINRFSTVAYSRL